MKINKNLGGIHIHINQSDTNSFVLLLKKALNKHEGFSFALEKSDNKSYSTLNISLSNDEDDYMSIKYSSINLCLSFDSIYLAIFKMEQFLIDDTFFPPEWCECESKGKMIALYFIKNKN